MSKELHHNFEDIEELRNRHLLPNLVEQILNNPDGDFMPEGHPKAVLIDDPYWGTGQKVGSCAYCGVFQIPEGQDLDQIHEKAVVKHSVSLAFSQLEADVLKVIDAGLNRQGV